MVNPKLIHITDLHFGVSADSILAGINPLDSFNAVLDAIDENGFGEELLLLSGDLSGVAHRNSYKMLNGLLKNRNKQVELNKIILTSFADDYGILFNDFEMLCDFEKSV